MDWFNLSTIYMSGVLVGLFWTGALATAVWLKNLPRFILMLLGMGLSLGTILLLSSAGSGSMDPFANPKMHKEIWTSGIVAMVSVPFWMIAVHLCLKWQGKRAEEFERAIMRSRLRMSEDQLWANSQKDDSDTPVF